MLPQGGKRKQADVSSAPGPATPPPFANGTASAGGDTATDGPAAKRQRTLVGENGAVVGTDDYDPLMLDPLTAPPPDLMELDEAGAAPSQRAAAPLAQGAGAPDEDPGADDLLKVGA